MKKIGLILIAILLIGIPLLLNFYVSRENQKRIEQTQRQPLKEIRYASNAYMQPIQEAGKPSVDKVQIRGVVGKWQKEELIVLVGKDEFRITVPDQVGLHCLESEVKDKNGLPITMKNVWLDFSRFGPVGTSVSKQKIIDKFPKDEDLLVVADVDDRKNFTASLVAGFGCDTL